MGISRGEASTFAADRAVERIAHLVADSFRAVDDSRGQFGVLGTVQCFHVIDAHFRVGIRQANPIELENSGHLRDGKGHIALSSLFLGLGCFCGGGDGRQSG